MSKRKRKNKDRPRVTIPEPFYSIVDQVCIADRQYFELHPWESEYIRQVVPGELWPLNEGVYTHIRVTRISSDCRTRTPCMAFDVRRN